MKSLGTTTLCPQAQKRAENIILPILNEMDSLRTQGKEHILARFVGEGQRVLVIAHIHGGFIVKRPDGWEREKFFKTQQAAVNKITDWL